MPGPSSICTASPGTSDRRSGVRGLWSCWAGPGEKAGAASLGVYALLVGEASEELTKDFVSQALGELIRYDAERGTSLLDTVEHYYEHDGNVAQAAQALFVHSNTLYQRLERVDRLLGPAWRSGSSSLEVRLALKNRRLIA